MQLGALGRRLGQLGRALQRRARLVDVVRRLVDARQRHERAHVRRIALEDALQDLRRRLGVLELLLPDVGRAHQQRDLARRVAGRRAPVGVLGQHVDEIVVALGLLEQREPAARWPPARRAASCRISCR